MFCYIFEQPLRKNAKIISNALIIKYIQMPKAKVEGIVKIGSLLCWRCLFTPLVMLVYVVGDAFLC